MSGSRRSSLSRALLLLVACQLALLTSQQVSAGPSPSPPRSPPLPPQPPLKAPPPPKRSPPSPPARYTDTDVLAPPAPPYPHTHRANQPTPPADAGWGSAGWVGSSWDCVAYGGAYGGVYGGAYGGPYVAYGGAYGVSYGGAYGMADGWAYGTGAATYPPAYGGPCTPGYGCACTPVYGGAYPPAYGTYAHPVYPATPVPSPPAPAPLPAPLASARPSPPQPPSPRPHPPSPPPKPSPPPPSPRPFPPIIRSPPSPPRNSSVPIEPTTQAGTGIVVPPNPTLAQPGEAYVGPDDATPAGFQSAYELFPHNSYVVAVHMVNVPGTDTFLYMERPSGNKPSGYFQIAGTLDLVSQVWTPVDTKDGLFCCGHTVLNDGQVVVVGGHQKINLWENGMKSIRLFNIRTNPKLLNKTTEMAWQRWYPTATLLPSGKVMIMGGTQGVGAGTKANPEYELFDPSQPFQKPLQAFTVDPAYLKSVKQNYYPFNYVLPSGDTFNFCGRNGRILHAETGTYRDVIVPFRPGYAHSQFPYTGTSVMLPLDPANGYKRVEVMIFGGNAEKATSIADLIAGRESHRMVVTWSANGTYSFSGWEVEDMGIPRVMGDATLLPNGDVVLLNGGQRGIAGDASNGGGSRANSPSLWAQLYQPDKPSGSRYTTLASTLIARMYHSVAALTTNGTVLVSGCDRCWKLTSEWPKFQDTMRRFEYRNEIFYPPYWYDNANKPMIVAINGDENAANIQQFGFDEEFTVTWTGLTARAPIVTSAVIVAASSVTHSFNMNQRVVILPQVRVNQAGRSITLKMPPHPNIAPGQMYMLFLLNGKTYGAARWVHLVDQQGVANDAPVTYNL